MKILLLIFAFAIAYSVGYSNTCVEYSDSLIQEVDTSKPTNFIFEDSINSNLNSQMKDYLRNIAEYLKKNPDYFVEIVGFSDNRGTPEQLMKRAYDRADAAKRFLISLGVRKEKILARGNGANNPVAPNNTEEGRRKNRRIEIKLKKKLN